MTIRRFEYKGDLADYIEYDSDTGQIYTVNEKEKRDYKVSFILSKLEKRGELPCYARDLIEGDIAVIKVNNSTPTYYTWYVFDSQDGSDRLHLAAVCLTHKGKYWDMERSPSSELEVVALLGNAFNSERLTYGVKRYVK